MIKPSTDIAAQALAIATAIANQLDQQAFHFETRCSWLGAEPLDFRNPAGLNVFKLLDPWLYEGNPGVAWFLAALYQQTGKQTAKELALQALTQAESVASLANNSHQLGMFAGWSGLAVAFLTVGQQLDDPLLSAQAHRFAMETILPQAGNSKEFDLIGGHAGDLLALLRLYQHQPDPLILTTCQGLGDKLLATACHWQQSCYWESPGEPGNCGLAGLSHGTSGAALALLELFAITGHQSYADTALKALDYERHFFNAEKGNWPDLRKIAITSKQRPNQYSAFWCHGAPGIALARLRAVQLVDDPRLTVELTIALATTRQEIRAYLQNGAGNLSLCHGLCGLGDILLSANSQGFSDADDPELIAQIVQQVHQNHVLEALPYPCGTHGAETPGMLLGLAGIGMFHLRVINPALPSPLSPWLG